MAKGEFGALQLAVLHVLWERGEARVDEVVEALRPDRDRATSTVATVLSRLDDQGVVSHRKEGRRYVYRPEVGRDEARESMVDGLLDRAFDGDALELVSHLVRREEIEGADLERLQALIDEHRG